MKKSYIAPDMEHIEFKIGFDVLSISTSSKSGEDDVPDVPLDPINDF